MHSRIDDDISAVRNSVIDLEDYIRLVATPTVVPTRFSKNMLCTKYDTLELAHGAM